MRLSLKTVAEHIYEDLRTRIVRAELAPLSPLPLSELASELGVSTMPVRAALGKLESDGLVLQFRHRVAVVAPLEFADLEVIQAVRAGVEGMAARLGAPVLDDAALARMTALLEGLPGLASEETVDDLLGAQWELHDICYAAAERPRLVDVIHAYQRRAERYARLAVGNHPGFEDTHEFQKSFVDACRQRSGDKAESVIRGALAYTVVRLEPLIRDQPGIDAVGVVRHAARAPGRSSA